MQSLRQLWHDDSATVAIEYALIGTLISIIAIASMIAIGGQVSGFFLAMLNGFSR
jgi:Flp pilus assembly pilin Flp